MLLGQSKSTRTGIDSRLLESVTRVLEKTEIPVSQGTGLAVTPDGLRIGKNARCAEDNTPLGDLILQLSVIEYYSSDSRRESRLLKFCSTDCLNFHVQHCLGDYGHEK